MKTLIANRKYFVLILAAILMGFGIQGSYGQTITASVQQPLTEANLHGSVSGGTLTLSGGPYERSSVRAGYSGNAFTVQLPVAALEESLVASTEHP